MYILQNRSELSILHIYPPCLVLLGGSKLVKFNVSGSYNQLNIKDLRENVTYLFSISARTIIGQGEKMDQTVTVGPQPGKILYEKKTNFINSKSL